MDEPETEMGTCPNLSFLTERSLSELRPSPENDLLYKPPKADDPGIAALANSIAENGLREPPAVSEDGWIVSGHRRCFAAKLAGLDRVPVRVLRVRRSDYDTDRWLCLIRDYNEQRIKTYDEKLRETLLTVDPDLAHVNLLAHRRKAAEIAIVAVDLREKKKRAKISPAKRSFLDAVLAIVEMHKEFWPLSVRQIHYYLLDDPPVRNAGGPRQPQLVYANDVESYKDLSDIATRARLCGEIAMDAIDDETRPITTWLVEKDVRDFASKQFDGFLKRYWRDLLQSQPHHIEVICEKNTVWPILQTVAADYCLPITSGRGYCSLAPRHKMYERFKKSGKEKLILLVASDFDPDGETICESFARSMRDDFGIDAIHPIKVALTHEQVKELKLPPQLKAKKKSPSYHRFVKKYGTDCFELEALKPKTLQKILRQHIDTVIDRKAFNHELDMEKQDAAWLRGVRQIAIDAMKGADFDLG
ncbi:MAG TPA: ParB/RepB/Spo0J family partition protein [Pirellulales bacterium]|nr:ParB/RepB/Spo0J family partition protein [Pirellulales bacterium]